MKNRPRVGATGELAFQIEPKYAIDFATNGMPAVLSTPNLVGFLERTAREAMVGCLDDGEHSVGIEIDIRHLAPTPVGQTIHCRAQVIAVEDRKVTFQISKPATSTKSSPAACTSAPSSVWTASPAKCGKSPFSRPLKTPSFVAAEITRLKFPWKQSFV
jgi:predicted thioesterase